MTAVLFIVIGMVLMLAVLVLGQRFIGFRAQQPGDYSALTPVIDVRDHLSGPIRCEGVIYGPTGRISSRFTADMNGVWEGNKGVLTENFQYDSGTTQSREWQLSLRDDARIEARAEDIIGVGQGRQQGAAVRLDYTIRLPDTAGGHQLSVTDWMYLIDERTIVNRSQFRKFGIKVAELVATMRKVDP